jgi:transcription termination factor NusB
MEVANQLKCDDNIMDNSDKLEFKDIKPCKKVAQAVLRMSLNEWKFGEKNYMAKSNLPNSLNFRFL